MSEPLDIIIVDDDPSTVQGLQTLVDWASVGMSCVGTAYDGFSALQLVHSFHPDILVTDISMPVMNGLELAEKALAVVPDLSIILLSAYKDFDYARKGIELGAEAYVTKPINYSALQADFIRYGRSIQAKKQIRHQNNNSSDSGALAMDELLAVWFAGGGDEPWQTLCCRKEFRPVMSLSTVTAAVVDCVKLTSHASSWQSNSFEEIRRIAHDFLIKACTNVHAIVFFSGKSSAGLLASPEDCRRAVTELLAYIEEECGAKLLVGIGPECEPKRSPASWAGASQALLCSIVDRQHFVFEYSNCEEKLKRYPLAEAAQNARQFMGGIRDLLPPIANYNAGALGRLSKKMRSSAVDGIMDYLLRECIEMLPPGDSFTEILAQADRSVGVETALKNSILIWRQSQLIEKRAEGLVVKIMEWVNSHVEQDITLKSIAEKFFLTPNYIGKLFFEETGEYFSDYVLRRKMERICEYLEDPQYKVYELADRMGFRNLSNFHAKFRFFYGCSPAQYRKKI